MMFVDERVLLAYQFHLENTNSHVIVEKTNIGMKTNYNAKILMLVFTQNVIYTRNVSWMKMEQLNANVLVIMKWKVENANRKIIAMIKMHIYVDHNLGVSKLVLEKIMLFVAVNQDGIQTQVIDYLKYKKL